MRNQIQLALLACLAAVPAMAQEGDAVAGRVLAQRLCSSCHLVTADQAGPVPDGVPSFMAVAARPDMTRERLVEVMISPSHAAMPPPPLERSQMQDVAAYLLSLRRS
jgi:mono/diheme cytochrome c family protein